MTIDLYEVFETIKKKPSMYLGRKSIFSLEAFYYGYFFVRNELGLPSTEQEEDFANKPGCKKD